MFLEIQMSDADALHNAGSCQYLSSTYMNRAFCRTISPLQSPDEAVWPVFVLMRDASDDEEQQKESHPHPCTSGSRYVPPPPPMRSRDLRELELSQLQKANKKQGGI